MNDSSGINKDSLEAKTRLDHSSHKEFFDYYEKQSQSEISRKRFLAIREMALTALSSLHDGGAKKKLKVADIGCGAGTQSLLWAELGHSVFGVDINAPLIELAAERTKLAGFEAEYRVGTATELPWEDNSMDLCLAPELLEHVPEWERCLDEFTRILAPGGLLLITTNNTLCPVQDEFKLPLYSWYPGRLKRYCEKLAVTTRPELANYAKYPAVNWFTYYSLSAELAKRGCRPMDRFDVMDTASMSGMKAAALTAIRRIPPFRFLAHVLTPYTVVLAVKQ